MVYGRCHPSNTIVRSGFSIPFVLTFPDPIPATAKPALETGRVTPPDCLSVGRSPGHTFALAFSQ